MADVVREPHAAQPRALAVVVRDLHVTYRVYEDGRRPTFKESVARGVRRPRRREVQALRGVSFEVAEGEAVGLIGRNGSGKSTLLRTVAGLLPATEGRVLARSEPVLLGVGAALHPQLSGRRNIFLGATALGLRRKEVEHVIEDIVQFAGVRDFIDMPIRAYSSGMAARLRFAIASAVTPDILLVDEALNVGDEEFKQRCEQKMREQLDRAGAIMLVSHSLKSVTDLCTRALWLDGGKIRMDGAAEEVVAAYRSVVRQPETSGTPSGRTT